MSCAPGVLVETIQAVLRLAIDGQQARAVRALAVSTRTRVASLPWNVLPTLSSQCQVSVRDL
jgi:hypothetical protein